MILGKEILRNERWEKFSKTVSVGVQAPLAYQRIYKIKNFSTAKRAAYRLLRNPEITSRIDFLVKARTEGKGSGASTDLQSVIQTCIEIMETEDNIRDRLAAITTLERLGVFKDEEKGDGERMDPSAICEYLASFAAKSAKELARIPDGLKDLMKRLVELTGASVADLKSVLDELDIEFKESFPKTNADSELDNLVDDAAVLEAAFPKMNKENNGQADEGSDEGSGEIYEF